MPRILITSLIRSYFSGLFQSHVIFVMVIGLNQFNAAATLPKGRDTLELPPILIGKDTTPNAGPAKTILIPTDEDRLLSNLGDLMQRVSGIHIVRTGDIGDYLGISIRGSSEQQVNVYVNGVLQNQATDPSLFLSDWDLSRVEKIEIYKGMVPDDFPGNPMGGAINIITRKSLPGTNAQVDLGAGSFGSLRGHGSADFRGEGWGAYTALTGNRSQGNFTYYDDNGTEFQKGRNPDGIARLGEGDLTKKIRQNNSHELLEADGSFSMAANSSTELGFEANFSKLHKQIPAPYANIDNTFDFTTFRESDKYSCHSFLRWAKPNHSLSFDISGSLRDEIYVDTANGRGAIGIGYNNDQNSYDDFLAMVSGKKSFTDRFSISGMISYGISGYQYNNLIKDKIYPWLFQYTGNGKVTSSYVAGRHALQAVLSRTLNLQEYSGESIFAYGGVPIPTEQWDKYWALQGGYQYKPREWLWVSALIGNSYRIPTLMEKFGDRGTLVGNPNLKPEEGTKASLSFHVENLKSSLEIQAFAGEGHRIISLVQNSQSVLFYINTGGTRTFGVETALTEKFFTWSRTEVNLTLQKAINLSGFADESNFKDIPYRPRTQASLRQAFLHRGFTLAITGYYQGLAYPNASNMPSIFDSYSHNTDWQSQLDFSLSWRWRKILMAAGMQNALDQKKFDFFNFPLPGRSLNAAIQVEI